MKTDRSSDSNPDPPRNNDKMSREEIRFLADVAAKVLSTTVSRYHRLNLSRRRGNAIRQRLQKAGIIASVPIATRAGQVVLYQLTDLGRGVCADVHIDPGPRHRESLEHQFWVRKAAEHFEKKGYDVKREHVIKGNGAIDLLAERPGERIAVEVETGKSDIKRNIANLRKADFDGVVVIATSPEAATACRRAIDGLGPDEMPRIEWLTWLDVS